MQRTFEGSVHVHIERRVHVGTHTLTQQNVGITAQNMKYSSVIKL